MKTKLVKTTIIVMCLSLLCVTVFADTETSITSSSYYQLGEYNGNPILWRPIVSDDENGILMVSDKILSYRIFNVETDNKVDNHWENTALRVWLNSPRGLPGAIEWFDKYVPSSDNIHKYYSSKNFTPYADEKGFLNNDNFTDSEKSVMKTVSHWQALWRRTPHICLKTDCENHFTLKLFKLVVHILSRQFIGIRLKICIGHITELCIE